MSFLFKSAKTIGQEIHLRQLEEILSTCTKRIEEAMILLTNPNLSQQEKDDASFQLLASTLEKKQTEEMIAQLS